MLIILTIFIIIIRNRFANIPRLVHRDRSIRSSLAVFKLQYYIELTSSNLYEFAVRM